MANIIDGKAISAIVREEIAKEVIEYNERTGLRPGLAVVIVGNDPASQVYVRNKKKACEQVGFNSWVYELPESTTQEELNLLIDQLNEDSLVHGILVQLPLPSHLDEEQVVLRIKPQKDVDAFHPYNVGRITIGNPKFLPCTPAGVMELLHRYGINVSGKECVVIGRSNIVGKPMALLLLSENGTVTVCHSKTRNLKDVCKRADILVVAIGKANFVTFNTSNVERFYITVNGLQKGSAKDLAKALEHISMINDEVTIYYTNRRVLLPNFYSFSSYHRVVAIETESELIISLDDYNNAIQEYFIGCIVGSVLFILIAIILIKL